ncbi:MAG: CDP-2,3-bis-(O-geranylgeranyl)-sn-glycerol synthase [Pyrobaculum sp.]|uniref:CDP-2,3-bis-(O-geranylgeranyl)-sn-glycerol synthase n=1 Tax=Pyrobaculum sp. TaxID=2004705 RepID=UPI000FFC3F90
MWPPYVANGSAVLASRLKWRHPVDFGRNFVDGRRLFGDGKTYEGLAIGVFLGTVVGYLPNLLHTTLTLLDALILSVAALLGDLLGAFIKRRLCMPRGHPAFPLDQLDFILMAMLVRSLYADVPVEYIIAASVVTPIIHRVTNIVAYILRLKKEPW